MRPEKRGCEGLDSADGSPSFRLLIRPHRLFRIPRIPRIRLPVLKRTLLGELGVDLGRGLWGGCPSPAAGRGGRGVARGHVARSGVVHSRAISRSDFIPRAVEIRPVLLEAPAFGVEPEDLPIGFAAIEGARHGQLPDPAPHPSR